MTSSTKPALILASASPRRQKLLEQIGIVPDRIIPADLDETPRRAELPRAYAMRVAMEKADHVSAQLDIPALILAADTVVAVGRRILGKAESEDQARAYLKLLSGRRHTVVTAVVLKPSRNSEPDRTGKRLVATQVAFSCLTAHHIDALIASGDWQGKAGGYALQGMAARFIRFVSGSPSAVIGLPLFETSQLLQGQPDFDFRSAAQ